jgi:hypothetical protein
MENKEENKKGRPKIDLMKEFEKIKPYLQVGYSFHKACVLGRVNYTTLYNYYKEDEEFRNMVERERSLVNVLARQVIIEKIRDEKDSKLALEWLDRMEKDDFSKRLELDLTDENDAGAKELLFYLFKKQNQNGAKE